MRLSWPAALSAAAPQPVAPPPPPPDDDEEDDAVTGTASPSPAAADSDVDEAELRRELLNDKWRQLFDKYDPEGFGEIPWEEFLEALRQPDFLAEVDANKRDILAERARERRTTAITFQDFVNVMSGKRSRSFKCAVHQRDREVSSENDFHVLAREPPAFRKMVRLIADEFLTEERDRKYYADHYSCCPPPLFVVFVTLLELGFFTYYTVATGEMNPSGPVPIDSVFIYRPDKRLEVWRFVFYMVLHAGWLHLLFNLLVQLLVGLPLEMVHGSLRIGAVYMAGVLAGEHPRVRRSVATPRPARVRARPPTPLASARGRTLSRPRARRAPRARRCTALVGPRRNGGPARHAARRARPSPQALLPHNGRTWAGGRSRGDVPRLGGAVRGGGSATSPNPARAGKARCELRDAFARRPRAWACRAAPPAPPPPPAARAARSAEGEERPPAAGRGARRARLGSAPGARRIPAGRRRRAPARASAQAKDAPGARCGPVRQRSRQPAGACAEATDAARGGQRRRPGGRSGRGDAVRRASRGRGRRRRGVRLPALSRLGPRRAPERSGRLRPGVGMPLSPSSATPAPPSSGAFARARAGSRRRRPGGERWPGTARCARGRGLTTPPASGVTLAFCPPGSLGTSVFDTDVYLVGASGGVYALLAAHLANVLLNYNNMEFGIVRLIGIFVVASADVGFAVYDRYAADATQLSPPVSYVAHLTGALAGLTIGLLVLKNFEQKLHEQLMWWVALGVYAACTLFAVLFNVFNPAYV